MSFGNSFWDTLMFHYLVPTIIIINFFVVLVSGKEHELHPQCTERDHPSIVVTPCESGANGNLRKPSSGVRIPHTAVPPSASSSSSTRRP